MNSTTLDLLRELHAMVMGECPSLLNEDSGGNGQLALDIEEALATPPAEKQAAPSGEGKCATCKGLGYTDAGDLIETLAAPQAPSGQQAEPTELLRAMVGWYSTHGTLHHSDVMGKAKAFLAKEK